VEGVKPRLSVSRLLDHIYGGPGERVPEEILLHGEMAHRQVYEAYAERCKSCEYEVPLELDRGFYVLHGRVDIVDHDNKWIVEVKTRGSVRSERARMQLSAYVAMYRELYGPNNYYGVWLVYDWREPSRFYIVKPFWLDMTVLSVLDRAAREILGGSSEGEEGNSC